jgi:hypothetical protein
MRIWDIDAGFLNAPPRDQFGLLKTKYRGRKPGRLHDVSYLIRSTALAELKFWHTFSTKNKGD